MKLEKKKKQKLQNLDSNLKENRDESEPPAEASRSGGAGSPSKSRTAAVSTHAPSSRHNPMPSFSIRKTFSASSVLRANKTNMVVSSSALLCPSSFYTKSSQAHVGKLNNRKRKQLKSESSESEKSVESDETLPQPKKQHTMVSLLISSAKTQPATHVPPIVPKLTSATSNILEFNSYYFYTQAPPRLSKLNAMNSLQKSKAATADEPAPQHPPKPADEDNENKPKSWTSSCARQRVQPSPTLNEKTNLSPASAANSPLKLRQRQAIINSIMMSSYDETSNNSTGGSSVCSSSSGISVSSTTTANIPLVETTPKKSPLVDTVTQPSTPVVPQPPPPPPPATPQPKTDTQRLIIVPSWRVVTFRYRYKMEGTENLSDEIYAKRHQKYENEEKQIQKWDMRRQREEQERNKLMKGRQMNNSTPSNGSTAPTVVASPMPAQTPGSTVVSTPKSLHFKSTRHHHHHGHQIKEIHAVEVIKDENDFASIAQQQPLETELADKETCENDKLSTAPGTIRKKRGRKPKQRLSIGINLVKKIHRSKSVPLLGKKSKQVNDNEATNSSILSVYDDLDLDFATPRSAKVATALTSSPTRKFFDLNASLKCGKQLKSLNKSSFFGLNKSYSSPSRKRKRLS